MDMTDASQSLLTWRLFVAFVQGKPAAEVIQRARELGGGVVSHEVQQTFLRVCLHHPLVIKYPVPAKQCAKALKLLLSSAEADGQDVVDPLAQEVCSQVTTQGATCSAWGHKTFAYLPDEDTVASETGAGGGDTLAQCGAVGEAWELMRRAVDEGTSRLTSPMGNGRCGLITLHLSDNMFEGSTGCHEWEAGFVLAEMVLNNPHIFEGRNCLEIGCGAGVVGICLGRVGAARVTCTDGDMQTVENCRRNLLANNDLLEEEGRWSCQELHWEEKWRGQQPDVILGADLLYDPGMIPVLVMLMLSVLPQPQASKDSHMCAYIATTLRNQTTMDAFVDAVTGAGLHIEECTKDMQRQHGIRFQDCAILANRSSVKIHRIRRNA